MDLLLALFALGGMVIAGLSVPLILAKIPPNRYYGFPARSILNDPQLWYKINAYAGRRFMLAGMGTSVGSIVLYYLTRPDYKAYAFNCLGMFIAFVIWSLVSSFLYLRAIQDHS